MILCEKEPFFEKRIILHKEWNPPSTVKTDSCLGRKDRVCNLSAREQKNTFQRHVYVNSLLNFLVILSFFVEELVGSLSFWEIFCKIYHFLAKTQKGQK